MASKKQLSLEPPAAQFIRGTNHWYKSNLQFAVSGSQVVLYCCLGSRVQGFKLSKPISFFFESYIWLTIFKRLVCWLDTKMPPKKRNTVVSQSKEPKPIAGSVSPDKKEITELSFKK